MTDSTPGPWFYEYDNDAGPDDDDFLEFHKIKNTGLIRRVVGEARNASDARLMAAAPDLLGALEALFQDYKQLADSGDAGFLKLEDQESGKRAIKAMAKAKGEHP